MKLSEAIAEIEQDNGKMFKNRNYLLFCGTNCIVCKDNTGEFVYFNMCFDRNWQPVKPEPRKVDFMEAVAAFHNFKTIYCKDKLYGGICATYKRNGGSLALDDTDGIPIGSAKILEMDWYVLED